MTQLDLKLSAKRRDRALAAVKAPPAWWVAAASIVRNLAAARGDFTSDDVWRRLDKPPEPRALGALMRRLAVEGVIQRVGYRATAQVSRHGAPIAVWRGCP